MVCDSLLSWLPALFWPLQFMLHKGSAMLSLMRISHLLTPLLNKVTVRGSSCSQDKIPTPYQASLSGPGLAPVYLLGFFGFFSETPSPAHPDTHSNTNEATQGSVKATPSHRILLISNGLSISQFSMDKKPLSSEKPPLHSCLLPFPNNWLID